VLVVTDVPFAMLHGEDRITRRALAASAALFRPVLPVLVADDASPDIVIGAVLYASESPFAVLFPRRFAAVAERFHGERPDVTLAVFRGSAPPAGLPAGNGVLNVFGTDSATDLFRAGLFAGILGAAMGEADGEGGQRIHALVHDARAGGGERSLFAGAATGRDPGSAVVFAGTAAELPDLRGVSSLVAAGAGADALERNPGVPVVLFSWLDPDLTSSAVVAMFDDSPWALAVPAVRMAARGEATGTIPSKPLVFSRRIADNGVSRALRRAASAVPQETNVAANVDTAAKR